MEILLHILHRRRGYTGYEMLYTEKKTHSYRLGDKIHVLRI